MKPILNSALFTAMAGAMLLALGCDSEDRSKHDVEITWKIDDFPICQKDVPDQYGGGNLTFDTVKITVYENEGDEEPYHKTVPVTCDSFSYTIRKLERGSYVVTIEAEAEYDGVTLPYYKAVGEIEAPAKDQEIPVFNLTLNTGEVQVTWGFDMGVCATNSVSEVLILLESSKNGNVPPYEKWVSCNEENGWLIKDIGWDEYNLSMEAYTEKGELTHKGDCAQNPFKVRPGQVIEDRDAYVQLVPLL